MANTLTPVIPQLLAQGLMALRENSVMPRLVNRAYDSMAAERGSTIEVPVPSAISAQAVVPAVTPPSTADVAPTSVNIVLDQWFEAPFYLTDKERAEVMAGTIPMQASEAVKALANKVDQDLLGLYVDVYGFQGTPGTTPFASDTSDATQIRKLLNNQLSPLDPRRFVIDPDAEANALDLRAFQDMSFSGNAEGIREGRLNRKLGFDWFMDQNIATHTNGTLTDTSGHQALVNLAPTIGDKTQEFDAGSLSGTVTKGSVFTVAGDTQTYVVTANATAAGNAITLNFEPGAKVAWANNAQMTLKGGISATYVNNLAFHRDAFAFATRPLEQRAEGLGSLVQSAVDPVSGLALRLEVSREHKRTRWSFDVLYGYATVRRELAARLVG